MPSRPGANNNFAAGMVRRKQARVDHVQFISSQCASRRLLFRIADVGASALFQKTVFEFASKPWMNGGPAGGSSP
jgi:hypothetical protein